MIKLEKVSEGEHVLLSADENVYVEAKVVDGHLRLLVYRDASFNDSDPIGGYDGANNPDKEWSWGIKNS